MHIHLTAHSTYSLHQGLMTPAELVQAARAHGMPALGLTDHHLLTGAIEFVTACKQSGIQPIIGLEIDLLASYSKDLIALTSRPRWHWCLPGNILPATRRWHVGS